MVDAIRKRAYFTDKNARNFKKLKIQDDPSQLKNLSGNVSESKIVNFVFHRIKKNDQALKLKLHRRKCFICDPKLVLGPNERVHIDNLKVLGKIRPIDLQHVEAFKAEMLGLSEEPVSWKPEELLFIVNKVTTIVKGKKVVIYEVLEGQHRTLAMKLANEYRFGKKEPAFATYIECVVYENLDHSLKMATVRDQQAHLSAHLPYSLTHQVFYSINNYTARV